MDAATVASFLHRPAENFAGWFERVIWSSVRFGEATPPRFVRPLQSQ
jgi:hypothetical protein